MNRKDIVMKIELSKSDFSLLLKCALRQCIERHGYESYYVDDILEKYISDVELNDLFLMRDSCRINIRYESRDLPEKRFWKRWYQLIDKEINRQTDEMLAKEALSLKRAG